MLLLEVIHMDLIKTGNLIRQLRIEHSMTQKELADKMNISDKTISKWERGLGCPDVTLLAQLSQILSVNINEMLEGDLNKNTAVGGNMKKTNYFVCPTCGNISLCTGNATVSCCGRTLTALEAKKASDEEKLKISEVEDEWYIETDHPMIRENYISFVAFVTGDKIQMTKLYPEWDMQVRVQRRGHGKLIWYSTTKGLFYQLI